MMDNGFGRLFFLPRGVFSPAQPNRTPSAVFVPPVLFSTLQRLYVVEVTLRPIPDSLLSGFVQDPCGFFLTTLPRGH